jgi:hypothetical protein
MTDLLGEPIRNSPDNLSLSSPIQTTGRDEREAIVMNELKGLGALSGSEHLMTICSFVTEKSFQNLLIICHNCLR